MRKENGVWHIEENWFWNYVWGFNSLYFTKMIAGFPLVLITGDDFIPVKKSEFFPVTKSRCLLFWGSLFGIILTPCSIIFGISGFLLVSILMLMLIGIPAFLGFYINRSSSTDTFYPYKHLGDTKIPVALWEVFAVLLALYLVVTSSVYIILTLAVVLVVIIAVVVAASLLSDTLKAIWGRIKAAHRRLCPLVVIEPKRK